MLPTITPRLKKILPSPLSGLTSLTGLWAALCSVGIAIPALAAPQLQPLAGASPAGGLDVYLAGTLNLPIRSQPSSTQGGATRSGSVTDLKYFPPSNLPKRQRPITTGGAATRSMEIILELLAPYDHTGLTAAIRPTFAWYISDIPAEPMELTVRNEKTREIMFQQQLLVKHAGIIYFSLPPEARPLQPGVEYNWSLTMQPGESSVVHQAWIQRQALTPEHEAALKTAKSRHEQAIVYANSGFWYDAVALVTADYLVNPESIPDQDNLLGLLAQVDLDQMVDLEPGLLTLEPTALSSTQALPKPKLPPLPQPK